MDNRIAGKAFPRLVKTLRELHAGGGNILSYVHARLGSGSVDELSIMLSYDFQAGSYIRIQAEKPSVAKSNKISADKLADILDQLQPASFLDAGVGEATMTCGILNAMERPPLHRYGFDISLSRLLHGREWAREQEQSDLKLYRASLSAIPILDDTFDVVLTNHAIEPNRGKEREILAELYRISRRYLVLREPSWQFGDRATRAWIERHCYIKDLAGALRDLDYKVIEHRPFGEGDFNTRNRSALTIVEKRLQDRGAGWEVPFPECPYASPFTKTPLIDTGEALYSNDEALLYPIISGIPCLLQEDAIFSAHYGAFHYPRGSSRGRSHHGGDTDESMN